MKKICIVTPVYNGFELISDTLLSLLNQQDLQSYQLTYIVCDGGSTDGTVELLHKMAPEFSSKKVHFEIISGEDKGMYDALVKGFIKAGEKHDIYAYINAGDYYAPYALREVVQLMETGIEWLTGMRSTYNSKGVLIETRVPVGYPSMLITQGFFGTFLPHIQQESTFWSIELHKTLNLVYLSSFSYAGDFYLWSTFSKVSELRVVKAWLSGFRIHPGQLSERFSEKYSEEFSEVATPKTTFAWGYAIYVWILLKLPLGLRLIFAPRIIKI